jgi:hypothetical protein
MVRSIVSRSLCSPVESTWTLFSPSSSSMLSLAALVHGLLQVGSQHHGSLVYRVTGGGDFGDFGCLDRYQRVMISRTANAITAPKSTDRNAVTTTSFSAMH